jgi:lipocalin
MRYSVILLITASVACAAAIPIAAPPGAGICSNFTYAKEKTQPTLDAKRYAGVWFEQGRSKDFIFDHNCFCSTANYTLEDGYIGVANRCRKGSVTGDLTGPTHGKATCPDPKFVNPPTR